MHDYVRNIIASSYNLVLTTLHNEPPHFSSSRDERGYPTRFLCASRPTTTIVVTQAQRARQAPAAPGTMNQGQQLPPAPQAQQQAPPAPQAQPAIAAAPPVLPAPQPPVVPPPPAPAAFALGPGRSHAVLDCDDPNTEATATKLYNKAIAPLEEKFDGEAGNLAVLLASVRDRA